MRLDESVFASFPFFFRHCSLTASEKVTPLCDEDVLTERQAAEREQFTDKCWEIASMGTCFDMVRPVLPNEAIECWGWETMVFWSMIFFFFYSRR